MRTQFGGSWWRWILPLSFWGAVVAAEAPPKNTQPLTVPYITPQEALSRATVPPGFRVSLFASEPAVLQPIAIATDSRGRLWVVENHTYAESQLNFDLSQRDRILILEDRDRDGTAETRHVFWDQGKKLTSVEPGFGGVWVLAPPQLLFIPDRNGDDLPDGEPEVVLDGWDDASVRHNIVNGLRWGPDGWLYGRHGILATSRVGAPGTPAPQRTPLNCGIWRYHPTRKLFEVVCRGTTNPWGSDWNDQGELFFINTVINHLFHVLPGSYYERMYGEHDNPYLYQLMRHSADHYHWDTAEVWSDIRKTGVTPTTDQAGGGHAHSGLMFSLGTTWPAEYRNTFFTINLHGRRLNNDAVTRKGTGFVGTHRRDHFRTTDPWFRGIDLISSADGGIYLADWSDIGECHDNDGVHRSSGRILKIDYGKPARAPLFDLTKLSDAELITRLLSREEWTSRQARRILQERATVGRLQTDTPATLHQLFRDSTETHALLRITWGLHAIGADSAEWQMTLLEHPEEALRVWGIRLLCDYGTPPRQAFPQFVKLAQHDSSGLVHSYLASSLRLWPAAERWTLGQALVSRSEFARDDKLPLLTWYGLEPLIPEDPGQAIRLLERSEMPFMRWALARRLTENIRQYPQPVEQLVKLVLQSQDPERQTGILSGMAEGLRGWRSAPKPKNWEALQAHVSRGTHPELQQLVRDLSVLFGDGRSLQEMVKLAADRSQPIATRRDALRVLSEARHEASINLMQDLVTDRDLGADAARALRVFLNQNLTKYLVSRLPVLRDPARSETIATLCSTPDSSQALLAAIRAGVVNKLEVPAYLVRQMASMRNETLNQQLKPLWPELREVPAAKLARVHRWKQLLTRPGGDPVDLAKGRQRFQQTCASCHVLFGQGARIGPDLTGAQRSNLDYLLENLADPSALVGADFRISTVTLKDGRVLNGVVYDRPGETIAIQTATERLSIVRSDIDEVQQTIQSLMPEGLLDSLNDQQIRELLGYLMSPVQVPLTTGP